MDSPLGNPPQLRLAVIDVVHCRAVCWRETALQTPGGTYFFTVVTFRRRKLLCDRTMSNCCVRCSEPLNRVIHSPLMLLCCCRNTCIAFGHYRHMTMIIRCTGTRSKTILLAVARMPLNYRLLIPNDVNGRKPFGNHATGNTKSGMTETLKTLRLHPFADLYPECFGSAAIFRFCEKLYGWGNILSGFRTIF